MSWTSYGTISQRVSCPTTGQLRPDVPATGLLHDGEGLGKDLIERRPGRDPRLEFVGLGA